MTGVTEFTRKAGFAGVVSTPVALLVDPTPYVAGRGAPAVLALIALTVLVLGLASLAGLLVRHRMCRWMRAVLFVGSFAIAVGFVVSGELGAYGLAATMFLLILGILAEGFLPRVASLLVLVSWPIEMGVSEPAGTLLSVAGFVWLFWAMWREPLPRERARTAPA